MDTKTRKTHSARIRAELSHPVIDADGHTIEYGPAYFEFLKQVGGAAIAERYRAKLDAGGWYRQSPEERIRKRVTRPTSWGLPTKNTLDRATAMLPRLFRARMDDFGLDFSIVYSTLALVLIREEDEELRRATLPRAERDAGGHLRRAEGPHDAGGGDPTHTPEEAIAELEYAVRTLGFKAVMVNSNVRRPVPEVPEARDVGWMDRCAWTGRTTTTRCGRSAWSSRWPSPRIRRAPAEGSRVTSDHYIYNHVGSFAAAGEAFAKAVILGGVTRRFPKLNFAFLEGGVGWASELYAGLISHCGKRNPNGIGNYDPRNLDVEQARRPLRAVRRRHGAGRPDPKDPNFVRWPGGWHWLDDATDRARARQRSASAAAEDVRRCSRATSTSAARPTTRWWRSAFDETAQFGAQLEGDLQLGHRPLGRDRHGGSARGSPRARRARAHRRGDSSASSSSRIPAMLHAGMNPDFFKGTVVERDVAKLLGTR